MLNVFERLYLSECIIESISFETIPKKKKKIRLVNISTKCLYICTGLRYLAISLHSGFFKTRIWMHINARCFTGGKKQKRQLSFVSYSFRHTIQISTLNSQFCHNSYICILVYPIVFVLLIKKITSMYSFSSPDIHNLRTFFLSLLIFGE